MSSKKQKERKKKNREKVAKFRVLKRRLSLRQERKLVMEEQTKQQIAEDAIYGKQKPYVKKDVLTEEEKKIKAEELNSKLEHNLKILQALEEEYDKEQEQRNKINEDLEKEGFSTIKEKMDALHQKALVIEGKAEEYNQAMEEK